MSAHIYSLFPKKRGKLVRNNEDELLLINDDGKAFSTNDALIVAWQLCLGDKNINQICQDLGRHATGDIEAMNKNIIHLIHKLESADLIVLNSKKEKSSKDAISSH